MEQEKYAMVEKRVLEILSEYTGKKNTEKNDVDFSTISSVDFIKIIVSVETEFDFDFEFADEDLTLNRFKTIDEFIGYIAQRVEETGRK